MWSPEARLSVNDTTTLSDEVYFNTKHDCTIYTQVEISLTIYLTGLVGSFVKSGWAKRLDGFHLPPALYLSELVNAAE